MNKQIQHVRSKLEKTAVLLEHEILARYVPDTRRFSPKTLRDMLQYYGMVYVKPDIGQYGRGVMRAEERRNVAPAGFSLHKGLRLRQFRSLDELIMATKKIVGTEIYVVQRGIHMLTYEQRPFDIRVMVQQSPTRRWEATGIVARVAGPERIITNYYGGGSAHEVEPLLCEYLSRIEAILFRDRLANLGRRVALHLQRSYPYLREVGLDIAVDDGMRPWILEVNTSPGPAVFNALKDKTMFNKIISYAKLYGRKYSRVQ